MPKTDQATWRLLANIGDASPLDHGGYFVYTDETGVYPPEAELLEPLVDGKYELRRFILEPCTFVDGVLSDNRFHPNHPAWFADSLESIQESSDIGNIVTLLCSTDPIDRATAWRAIGEYHGFENLDSYPVNLTKKEAKKRYSGWKTRASNVK